MANPFRLVFGGPGDDVAAHHSSEQDTPTVNPAATVFANPAATVFAMPEGNMDTFETLVLTAEQLSLAQKAADAIKNGKVKIIEVPRSSGELHDESFGATYYEAPAQTRELYESLKQSAMEKIRNHELSVEKISLSTMKLSQNKLFVVQKSDVIVAIRLADSQTQLPVQIISPNTKSAEIPAKWPDGVACIIPRGWRIKSEEGELYMAIWRLA